MKLIIFIKNPILGNVKTRLAATVGQEKALQIYRELCAITRDLAEKSSAKCYLFYSDFIDSNDEWSPAVFEKHLQKQSNDLGERMNAAFQTVFDAHEPLTRTIIIGTDCPGISQDLLAQAFYLLDWHDVVLGPAEDGGYYLLGLKAPTPELFSDMVWSTNTVCTETYDRADDLGQGVHLLCVLCDIDTEADYVAWRSQL